eukprot:7335418-Pyramimonas_sp.AAC.1
MGVSTGRLCHGHSTSLPCILQCVPGSGRVPGHGLSGIPGRSVVAGLSRRAATQDVWTCMCCRST